MIEGEAVSSWTVFRLSKSHLHCHLWNFDWSAVGPPSLQSRVTSFMHAVEDGKAEHLILTGAPGIGKSHIGVGAYRVACALVGTELATWINVPSFCEAVKRSYRPGEVDPWSDYEAARRLVVLDDLFGRDLSQHEVAQIVYRLIDTAYTNGAAVLVNMNQDVRELTSRLASHEISRRLAGSTIIPMTATKDYRRG